MFWFNEYIFLLLSTLETLTVSVLGISNTPETLENFVSVFGIPSLSYRYSN